MFNLMFQIRVLKSAINVLIEGFYIILTFLCMFTSLLIQTYFYRKVWIPSLGVWRIIVSVQSF